ALRAAGGARKDGGRGGAGDVGGARRRRDREILRSVVVCAAEVRGLVERGEVRAQARDERVGASAGRALGAADGAREVRGVRLPRNVYVARRESNGDGKVAAQQSARRAAASEIRGLVERGQVGAEP